MFHENGTLEVPVAQAINSGKYTCVATNSLGISENHVHLEVKGEYCKFQKAIIEFVRKGWLGQIVIGACTNFHVKFPCKGLMPSNLLLGNRPKGLALSLHVVHFPNESK